MPHPPEKKGPRCSVCCHAIVTQHQYYQEVTIVP